MPRLASLSIYPLKAAAAVPLGSAAVARPGLAGDRRWMLVDAGGRFVSQRSHPGLARVTAAVDGRTLTATAPAAAALTVAMPPDAPRRTVTVWDDTLEAEDAGEAASDWFTAFVGAPCRLVRLPDDVRRPVDTRYGRPDDAVSFADAFPLLLATEASLAALNARLMARGEGPVPMERFRPNVVVAGTAPFAEDGWSRVRIGAVTFRVVKGCKRCTVVTVDQATGIPGREPLRTLATFRRGPHFPDPNGVYFGQNLIPDGAGTLHVGDDVEILED